MILESLSHGLSDASPGTSGSQGALCSLEAAGPHDRAGQPVLLSAHLATVFSSGRGAGPKYSL